MLNPFVRALFAVSTAERASDFCWHVVTHVLVHFVLGGRSLLIGSNAKENYQLKYKAANKLSGSDAELAYSKST